MPIRTRFCSARRLPTAARRTNTTGLHLAGGVHHLQAVFSGDGDHLASSSSVITLTVTPYKAPLVVVFDAHDPLHPVLGATLFPAVSGYQESTGTTTFYDGDTLLGTLQDFQQQAYWHFASLAYGTHTFRAEFSGSADYQANSTTITANYVAPAAPVQVTLASAVSM